MYDLRIDDKNILNLSTCDRIALETDHAIIYYADGREHRITDPDVLREVRNFFPADWRNPAPWSPPRRSRWDLFLRFLKGE